MKRFFWKQRKQWRTSTALSMELLQELLDEQTRELRDAQRTELGKATAQMRAEQKSLFAGVDQQLKEHKEDMQTIKSAHSDKPAALVFGGWGTGARTSLVLQELEASLKELHIAGKLDNKAYTPGIRKGVALAEFAVRDAETPGDMRNRMLDIIKTVLEADKKTPSMPDGKHLWASFSRPKGVGTGRLKLPKSGGSFTR